MNEIDNNASDNRFATAATTIQGWGLFPGKSSSYKPEEVWRYYFIDFNPLYFISPCCVMYGIFLITRNLDALNLHSQNLEQLILFCVIQLYEASLIAGAALLVNQAQALRPAILLCLLECVMLFDCTFRLESVTLLGGFGACLILCWVVLTLIKIWALAKIMRIQLLPIHYAMLTTFAGAIPVFVGIISQPNADKALVLQIAPWVGGLFMVLLEANCPKLVSLLASTEEQKLLTGRCITAAMRILVGFYFYHIWMYILFQAESGIQALAVFPQLSAFFLFRTLTSKNERHIWFSGALMIISSTSYSSTIPYALLVVAAAFIAHVIRGRNSNLAIGAALAAYASTWFYGWHGEGIPMPGIQTTPIWSTVLVCLALLYIYVAMHNALAGILLGSGCIYALYVTSEHWLPNNDLGRGMIILAVGFIALAAGIAINLRLKTKEN